VQPSAFRSTDTRCIALAAIVSSALLCNELSAQSSPAPDIEWSDRQRAYLRSKGAIRMCVAPDWMPIEGIDRKGRHAGMAADFMQLMARRGGLNIELVPARTWDESFAMAGSGDATSFRCSWTLPRAAPSSTSRRRIWRSRA
jgi:hypothetical protein